MDYSERIRSADAFFELPCCVERGAVSVISVAEDPTRPCLYTASLEAVGSLVASVKGPVTGMGCSDSFDLCMSAQDVPRR